MLHELKPKNARSARAIARKAPLVRENAKTTLLLKASKSSSLINDILADVHLMKKPYSIKFSKKNDIHPFEDASSLEFFSQKNDASLIAFASHSKKRPHALTLVRCFDGHILDMLECLLNAETTRAMHQFRQSSSRVNSKPILSFSGFDFDAGSDTSDELNKLALAKSLLTDFFRGPYTEEVDVEGLQTQISFIARAQAAENGTTRHTIHMRTWRIMTKRSGAKIPRIELEEIGPRLDFQLGRFKMAEERVQREARKVLELNKQSTKKNVSTDLIGDKVGKIHIGRQDLETMQSRKMKGLKRSTENSSALKRGFDNVDQDEESSEGDRTNKKPHFDRAS